MTHLPNEVWLLIASCCQPRDLWLSLRPLSRQLQQCAEQFFEENLLPKTKLTLPVSFPTYDVRSPIYGKAVFLPLQVAVRLLDSHDDCRITYSLTETDPETYETQFRDRWSRMSKTADGYLDEKMKWEVQLFDRRVDVKLKDPMATGTSRGADTDAIVSFDWKCSMTIFFR